VSLQRDLPVAEAQSPDTASELCVSVEDELADELARLTGIALLLCRDRALAEDLAAEAVARVLRRTRVADVEQVRPYLRRTLINLVTRDRRRKATELVATARSWSPAVHVEPGDIVATRSEIRRALDSLPLDQRVVVVLRYFDDMTARQVAEVLKVPIGTIESRASRAIAAMRAVLGEGAAS
jgi:RNA polymerase sigma factor (sigma-70 family)